MFKFTVLSAIVSAEETQKEILTIYEGDKGEWQGMKKPEEDGYFVCGAQMRIQKPQGKLRDDTSANGLKVKFCNKKNWNDQKELTIVEGDQGEWGQMKKCVSGSYVSGM